MWYLQPMALNLFALALICKGCFWKCRFHTALQHTSTIETDSIQIWHPQTPPSNLHWRQKVNSWHLPWIWIRPAMDLPSTEAPSAFSQAASKALKALLLCGAKSWRAGQGPKISEHFDIKIYKTRNICSAAIIGNPWNTGSRAWNSRVHPGMGPTLEISTCNDPKE